MLETLMQDLEKEFFKGYEKSQKNLKMFVDLSQSKFNMKRQSFKVDELKKNTSNKGSKVVIKYVDTNNYF